MRAFLIGPSPEVRALKGNTKRKVASHAHPFYVQDRRSQTRRNSREPHASIHQHSDIAETFWLS